MVNIKDFYMKDYITSRLHVPVVLDNDSNVAALAEWRHGAGRGSRHMVYMASSTGIGSGIIINGQLFRGSYGWAGESGHMIVNAGRRRRMRMRKQRLLHVICFGQIYPEVR